jgi:hypothetical protein
VERIRVPSPAASTTVRLDRTVILFLKQHVAPAVFNCFRLEIKPIRHAGNDRIQDHGGFHVNVCCVIRQA